MGHVLGHVDDDGAGPTAPCQVKRATDQLRDALDVFYPQQLLHRRAQDLHLPPLLRHVLARVQAVGITDQHHGGNTGVKGLDQAAHQVGGAGAERGIDHRRTVGDAGPGVGGEHGRALVVDQPVPHARRADGFVVGSKLKTGHAEQWAVVQHLDGLGQRRATSQTKSVGRHCGGCCVGRRNVEIRVCVSVHMAKSVGVRAVILGR